MEIPVQIIPIDHNGFHLWVEVVVFGLPFQAVIDTGASSTVFDKTIVSGLLQNEDLLIASEHLSAGLGTISMESFKVLVPDFLLGELHIPNLEVAVIDLSSINQAYGNAGISPVIGVIGGDILMKYKALIDYGNSVIKFLD